MQASLLTGLSCWAQRGSAFLCSCAQIMEPSIHSLEPVNRNLLCGWGETNFKADPKRKKKSSKLWHIYQIRSESERTDIHAAIQNCCLCNRYWVCLAKGLHPAKPVCEHFVNNYLHVANSSAVWGRWFTVSVHCNCALNVKLKPLENHFGCFLRG